MERSNKITSIRKILENVLKSSHYINDFRIHLLKKRWKDIVGEQLSEQVTPVAIKSEVLIVVCKHQGWISTLQFYKKEMLKKIQHYFKDDPKITDIKFTFNYYQNKNNDS